MIKNNFTFIIPAAGASKRFKSDKSKIFYKYKKKELIRHVVDKCLKFTNNIVIIINKKNFRELKKILFIYSKAKFYFVFQNQPKGMGHAIHLGLKHVKTKFSSVIWSDQIFLSNNTIKRTLNYFKKNNSLLCFPVYKKKLPYVYILRDKNKKFKDIIQTREGGKKISFGESDCGFFVFKTYGIKHLLTKLIKKKLILTHKTKEIDFLRSFKYFTKLGHIDIIKAISRKDTIGINYIRDLI
jgi:bifunctional N-acetylglucosamine-1-phosphate-uridyltransferase/glucosamine-1-phosphate-acetyltransferase GlmU-like protein